MKIFRCPWDVKCKLYLPPIFRLISKQVHLVLGVVIHIYIIVSIYTLWYDFHFY